MKYLILTIALLFGTSAYAEAYVEKVEEIICVDKANSNIVMALRTRNNLTITGINIVFPNKKSIRSFYPIEMSRDKELAYFTKNMDLSVEINNDLIFINSNDSEDTLELDCERKPAKSN